MKVSFRDRSPADVDHGLKIEYGPGKRVTSKWRWRIVLLLALSPLIYFIVSALYESFVIDSPGLVHMTSYTLRAPASGVFFASAPINVNDVFQEGQQLGYVRGQQIEERISLLEAEKKHLEGLEKSRMPATGADLAISAAKALVDNKQAQVDNFATLLSARAATLGEYQTALTELENARVQLGQLEATFRLNQQLNRKELIEQEIAALTQLAANSSLIRAASKGVVIKRVAVPGQFVTEGSPIVELADPESAFFMAYVLPKNVPYIKIGKIVNVKLADGRSIPARVHSLGVATEKKPEEFTSPVSSIKTSVPVRLIPENQTADFVYGMPFSVNFGIAIF